MLEPDKTAGIDEDGDQQGSQTEHSVFMAKAVAVNENRRQTERAEQHADQLEARQ